MFAAEKWERIKKNFKVTAPQICSRRRDQLTTSMSLYPNQDGPPWRKESSPTQKKPENLPLSSVYESELRCLQSLRKMNNFKVSASYLFC